MKIVTVLHSMKSGGAERHALQLMRGLRARGHEARYAGPMDGWLGQQLQADGFDGIDLPLIGLYDLPSIVRLALYARRIGADLIHGHLTRGVWYAGLAAKLARKTRSMDIRAFLATLQSEHDLSTQDASEIIQAQAFQDLVGQVINKLLVMVQKMEDSLVHLLVDDEAEPGQLAGPAVTPQAAISQDDVDNLFG